MNEMSIDEIKQLLTDHGIKASLPRVKIYDFMLKNRVHPTADEIYHSLVGELLTLSKTTVYNTLNIFVENGIIKPILVEDNEVRYDADTRNHGHFKCNACGKVFDFEYDLDVVNIKELKGFHPEEFHTYIRGLCSMCNKRH